MTGQTSFSTCFSLKNRSSELRRLIAGRSGKSGIVYCATRATVERVCADLKAHGVPAVRYHAGLEDAERQQNQDDFQYDRRQRHGSHQRFR